MAFERGLEEHLFALWDDLCFGLYKHSPYAPFTIFDPKQRTIHKATVRDRVAHQAIVNIIEPYFEKHFIYDSFSCRIGKGTHAAVERLRSFLRSTSLNGTRTVYALKCDVRQFFASVNHQILLDLVGKRIGDAQTIALIQGVVESFEVSAGKGIPLGNLTSQLFANVYLHELDWYVKQKMRIRHYVRYCDDFVILTDSHAKATALAKEIDEFVRNCLDLSLHPNKVSVRTWEQGVDFLGYVLLPHATILRPKTKRRAIWRVTERNATSYLGLCSHANAYEIQRLIRNKVGLGFPK